MPGDGGASRAVVHHCQAGDRLALSSLEQQAWELMRQGIAPSTQKVYASAERLFREFCNRMVSHLSWQVKGCLFCLLQRSLKRGSTPQSECICQEYDIYAYHEWLA